MRLWGRVALLTGAAAALRANGHDALHLHHDVTSEQNWAQVVDAAMAAHGRLDVLFNNAGVSFHPERLVGIHAGVTGRV